MDSLPGTNLVFLHIPKTAGLSVRAMFGIETDGYQHSTDTPKDHRFLGSEYIRFTVVRDPLSRYISAFKYNVGIAESQPTGVRRHLADRPDLARDINRFTDFLRRTYEPLSDATAHFHTQMHYLTSGRPQILLRQENLHEDLSIIRRIAPPELWQGNIRRNVSDRRFDLAGVNVVLDDEHTNFIYDYYKSDFCYLGYPPPSER